MLTSDLVRARAKGQELTIVRLNGKTRERAAELAQTLLDVVLERVGSTREEVKEAISAIDVPPRERKLLDGLAKLIDDECDYAEASPGDPVELRREVFLHASQTRQSQSDGVDFDREAVLAQVASRRGWSVEQVESALFSDLRGAHQLLGVAGLSAAALVERYERAQVQAVLLKAVRVVARVHCPAAGAARSLFRKLKFHRLLHQIEELGGGDYRISIDGPYSLFESVTKYGLQLALVLPALEDCERLELEAHVRWGKGRRQLVFRHEHRRPRRGESDAGDALADDVRALYEAFGAMDTPWTVAVARRVLALPGVGLCVPDLVFTHPKHSAPVYLEVLGYWSREAVWKRVELVESGLGEQILFAVSARLRVSEQVLDDSASAALYVYKGTLSPRSVERKLKELV
jgi:predicted nuclease of restriction endonuclease-like RecB superfamily